ncbi:MAG TPA: hypothetical protein EYG15_09205 [Deltaproteobacteria bacterium]|jgi:hypothetical protein|nr:hypothetical protein [Deltaproteobacteria bacterium]
MNSTPNRILSQRRFGILLSATGLLILSAGYPFAQEVAAPTATPGDPATPGAAPAVVAMNPEEATSHAVLNLAWETTRNKWRLHTNENAQQSDESGRAARELMRNAPIPPRQDSEHMLNQRFLNSRKHLKERYELAMQETRKRFDAFQRGRYQQMKYNGRWIDYTAPLQNLRPIARK